MSEQDGHAVIALKKNFQTKMSKLTFSVLLSVGAVTELIRLFYSQVRGTHYFNRVTLFITLGVSLLLTIVLVGGSYTFGGAEAWDSPLYTWILMAIFTFVVITIGLLRAEF